MKTPKLGVAAYAHVVCITVVSAYSPYKNEIHIQTYLLSIWLRVSIVLVLLTNTCLLVIHASRLFQIKDRWISVTDNHVYLSISNNKYSSSILEKDNKEIQCYKNYICDCPTPSSVCHG